MMPTNSTIASIKKDLRALSTKQKYPFHFTVEVVWSQQYMTS